ncbi:MAG: hypothetical protein K2H29_12275 [Oscillospiraceae bacterium]|nr:hypothetical protein [Oscillospiraceae bacterium]
MLTHDEKISLLKIQLGITTTAFDAVLGFYLNAACIEITREGITLTDDDLHLELMYAAWLWRKRDTGEAMPRMLRYQLNNRVFAEKGGSHG